MKPINITKDNSVCFYGKRLPKGAMYGEDKKGVWVCLDYRLYVQKMGVNGVFWGRVDGIKIAGYKLTMKLLRLKRRGINDEYSNRVDWKVSHEHGETIYKILEFKKQHRNLCRIEFTPHATKSVAAVKNGKLTIKQVPTVSNNETAKISSALQVRNGWASMTHQG